jgi:triosephosphate isomerase (TIM)
MRQTLIAGNWKMNGSHESVDHLLKSIKARASEVSQVELALFPPYVFLASTANTLGDTAIAWGAQNLSEKADGAFTGEISSNMLLEFGCRYVIVGHSERRTLYNEDNALVAAKFMAAMESGLRPILCLGESLEQRESGHTSQIISEQLDAALSLADNHPSLAQAVIAYEPIWAIGTGQQATPEQAQAVHQAIREQCRTVDTRLGDQIRIIYGGSVKPETAAGLFDMADIDGALVGGASLHADQFIDIALAGQR